MKLWLTKEEVIYKEEHREDNIENGIHNLQPRFTYAESFRFLT